MIFLVQRQFLLVDCGMDVQALKGKLKTIKFQSTNCSFTFVASASNEVIYFHLISAKFDENNDCKNYILIEDCIYNQPKLLRKICNDVQQNDYVIIPTSGSKLCLTIVKEDISSLEPEFQANFYSTLPAYDKGM